MTSECYFSVDVETDGPIPGPHSMLSLGAAAFIEKDGKPALISTFSRNFETLPGATMHPKTKSEFWDKQPKAWEECRKDPRDPKEAMGEFVAWVNSITVGKPVFVGYPAGFDQLFVYWYTIFHGYESPFSFSALDIKSYVSGYKAWDYRECTKRNMPRHWFPKSPHTHVAVEDAIEQGGLFMNILLENQAKNR